MESFSRFFERKYFTNQDKKITVYLNPTYDELLTLLTTGRNKLRGALDHDGYLFVWRYDDGLHHTISNMDPMNTFTIDIPFNIELNETDNNYIISPSTYRNRVTPLQLERLRNNPHIQKMMGKLKWTVKEKEGIQW
jgi:hypothetical protein